MAATERPRFGRAARVSGRQAPELQLKDVLCATVASVHAAALMRALGE